MLKAFINHQLKYGPLFKKRLRKIREFHEFSEDKRLIIESEKLQQLLKLAYQKSSFYKNLYDQYGVNLSQVQNREDLKILPVITKQDIKHKVDEIYFGKSFKHTAYTSGTSGSPLKVYYSLDCVLNEASYNEVFRNNGGHQLGQKVVSLRGVLGRSQLKSYDRFANTLFLSSYNLNEKNFQFYYNEIKNFQPNTILAYPSSLEILSNYLQKNGLELHVPVIFTSSETLYDFQREKIERYFNTKVYDRYGNAERTISLIQKKNQGDYKEAPLYSINEYKKDCIITTNLISPTFPLIRYQVDDVVQLRKDSDEVSIKEITGRIDDVLLLEDGTQIGRMDLVFKGVENVLYAQIIQERIGFFTVNLVKAKNFSIKDKNNIEQNIINRIGELSQFKLNFVQEKDLIKTKKGKYKLVINRAL